MKRSYGYVWSHRRFLARPMLVVFVLQLFIYVYSITVARSMDSGSLRHIAPSGALVAALPVYIGYPLSIVTQIVLLFGIHRAVLLVEIDQGIRFLKWDKNLLRYTATCLIVGAIIIALLFIVEAFLMSFVAVGTNLAGLPVTDNMQQLTIGVSCLIVGCLSIRVIFVLPGAAIGATNRFKIAWASTKQNWLRLIAAGILAILPLGLVPLVSIVPLILTTYNPQTHLYGGPGSPLVLWIVVMVFVAVIKVVELVVLAALLSLCYDVLVRDNALALIEHSDPAAISSA